MINSNNGSNSSDDNVCDDIIGIDLGTRYSCITIWNENGPQPIYDQLGNRTIPSVVTFYKSSKFVGNKTNGIKDVNSKNSIIDIKRLIGLKYDDEIIQKIKHFLPYDIIKNEDTNGILIKLDNSDLTLRGKQIYEPEEICSFVLREIIKIVQKQTNRQIRRAVITVPAYFNDSQRQATIDSARAAEIEVVRIINEPTAAALAYGLGDRKWYRSDGTEKNGGNVIIYDLGGGTLDISLININQGVFKILSVGGNTHLGGEDIDYCLIDHILNHFKQINKLNDDTFKLTNQTMIKLKKTVENCKKLLSSVKVSNVIIDDFYNGKTIRYKLTRKILEKVCNNIFIQCLKPLHDIFIGTSITKNDIDEVILVGGATRMPIIEKSIINFFSGTKIKHLIKTQNPDEVVSNGAALYGYILNNNKNPFKNNIVLLDVVPLSVGVETQGGTMSTIIKRNTPIPTKKNQTYNTDSDDQDSVMIKIFEGERSLTRYNYLLGSFILSGFIKGPIGCAIINVSFSIDSNGILCVTAYEKNSAVENSINITSMWNAKGRLSKEKIDQIVCEAKENEETDSIYSNKIELICKIKNICNAVLANINSDDITMSTQKKIKIKQEVSNIKIWIESTGFEALEITKLCQIETKLNNDYFPITLHTLSHNVKNLKCVSEKINSSSIYGDYYDADETDITTNIDDELNSELNKSTNNLQPDNNQNSVIHAEIENIKNSITDMCKNILEIIYSPSVIISSDNIENISDYLESVQIWLYTNNSFNIIDYTNKISEIDDYVSQYIDNFAENISQVVSKSKREELYCLCLTLIKSINGNFFSSSDADIIKLSAIVNENLEWLTNNIDPPESVCSEKIDIIDNLCNNIYDRINNGITESLNSSNADLYNRIETIDNENMSIVSHTNESTTDNTDTDADTDTVTNSTDVNIDDIINYFLKRANY
jgi:heat shock 70kDa protein 1/2/6/8